jgi:kynureninase
MSRPNVNWDRYRSEFYLPEGTVYLDGNSLGLLSTRAERMLATSIESWKTKGIDAWSGGDNPWMDLSGRVAAMMAPLIGAAVDCVTAANSTTVNLHQLLSTLYRPTESRSIIVIDACAFPSDRYCVESHLLLHDIDPFTHLRTITPGVDRLISPSSIDSALGLEVAVLLLPSVVYTTGQLLNIQQIVSSAHRKGIVVGIDCSHSIGAVPHEFDAWNVDFAVWCGYKYLNGGPGSSAGLYLNRRHHGTRPGLAGWFGLRKEKQFEMSRTFDFADGATSLQIGTPNILSMSPLLGSLEMIAEVGITALRQRSLELTGHLMKLVDKFLTPYDFNIVNPREQEGRGGHIALSHPEAIKICRAMKLGGVIPDFRYPDIIRLAPAPLYTTLEDCDIAVHRIAKMAASKTYEQLSSERDHIT